MSIKSDKWIRRMAEEHMLFCQIGKYIKFWLYDGRITI